jgi:hypothetical protein
MLEHILRRVPGPEIAACCRFVSDLLRDSDDCGSVSCTEGCLLSCARGSPEVMPVDEFVVEISQSLRSIPVKPCSSKRQSGGIPSSDIS